MTAPSAGPRPGPGAPAPARRDLGRRGHQRRAVQQRRRGRRRLPVRRRRRARRASRSRSRPSTSGTATCRRSGPGSATASASTGRSTPSPGQRYNPRKLLVDPYARAVEGELPARRRGVRLRCPGATACRTTATARRTSRSRSSCTTPSRGATTAGRDAPWADTVVYELHVKGFTALHPDIPPALRGHVRRARRTPPRSSTCSALGVTAVELHAGAPLRLRAAPAAQGADQLLGLQLASATSRRTPPTARAARAASRCASSRRWCARCTPPASRCCSTSSTTTPAEGDETGPTLSLRGIDNADLLPARGGDRARYRDYTGCGNTLDVRSPHVLQLIMDSLRYWVDRDARRRLPLRPRLGAARARSTTSTSCRRSSTIIQQDPVHQPGEAHRRAVGRRRGRLPGRRVPAAVDRVERQVPRHRPRRLARRQAATACASSPTGCPARPTSTRTTAGARTPRSTSSPRTTASRCATSRPTSASTTRRTARTGRDGDDAQPLVELRRRGRDRRRGRQRAAPAAGAQPARHAAAVDRRADADDGRRGAPHPARQQQRLLPGLRAVAGCRGTLDDDGAALRALRRAGCSRCAASTRCSGSRRSSSAGRSATDAVKDLAWFGADGQRADRRRSGSTRGAAPSACTSTAAASAPAARAASGSSTTASCCCCTPAAQRRSTSTLPGAAVGAGVRRRASTPRAEDGAGAGACAAGAALRCVAAVALLLRAVLPAGRRAD